MARRNVVNNVAVVILLSIIIFHSIHAVEEVDARVGCYVDHPYTPDLPHSYIRIYNGKASFCIDHCRRGGYLYAGVQGSACRCGNSYGNLDKIPKPDDCTYKCRVQQDLLKNCGGRNRNSIYKAITEVNCTWNEWSKYSACRACGHGIVTRTRTPVGQVPIGNRCIGDISEEGNCYLKECPKCGDVDRSMFSTCKGNDCSKQCNPVTGLLIEWSKWSECHVRCGGGKSVRHRACIGELYGAKQSCGEGVKLIESQDCNMQACKVCSNDASSRFGECKGSTCDCPKVDGNYSDWSVWDQCTKSCGIGSMKRTRKCTQQANYGGQECVGNQDESQECNVDPCPIDGIWSPYTNWTSCDKTCGGGHQTRTRICTPPQHGGNNCTGTDSDIRGCNSELCPVDGVLTIWQSWTACGKTCGEGLQRSRTRTCVEPQHGGRQCNGSRSDKADCTLPKCPIDGELTQWGPISECSLTCGGGTKSQHRACIAPKYHGRPCDQQAPMMRSEGCNFQECPVDGVFGEWSWWTECNLKCGGIGQMFRRRSCSPPLNEGKDCQGEFHESKKCTTSPCPVDGSYGEWTPYGACTKPCGKGSKDRHRPCTQPQHGGKPCFEPEAHQKIDCNTHSCPVDGYYSDWSVWDQCTKSCGIGSMKRTRQCTQPRYGGQECVGNPDDSQECNIHPCPIDGYFDEWSQFGECSQTCGHGSMKVRNRKCIEPQHGGNICTGKGVDSADCGIIPCPVDGYYKEWSEYVQCSKICGNGTKHRTRECVSPLNKGKPCEGEPRETTPCMIKNCPVNGQLSKWATWGDCSTTCGGGNRKRTRTYSKPLYGGIGISAPLTEEDGCNAEPCPIDGVWKTWSNWAVCTKTCGLAGSISRTRVCTPPENKGIDCQGEKQDQKPCPITEPCPIDGSLGEWSTYEACTKPCGKGSKGRLRPCTRAQYGGKPCSWLEAHQRIDCNTHSCPVNGEWEIWQDWQPCSKTCGIGRKLRSRNCVEARHGGDPCSGDRSDNQECIDTKCPINGFWDTWTPWNTCSETCDVGSKTRTRKCNEPLHGGEACSGDHEEQTTCTDKPCPVHGDWHPWTAWDTCTVTCGGGRQKRSRDCEPPKHGGRPCGGDIEQSQSCNEDEHCPVDAVMGNWEDWARCSVSCGTGGIKSRERQCIIKPAYGGLACDSITEEEPCDSSPCPVDAVVHPWTVWTPCSQTCGTGIRNRDRQCIPPTHGGTACPAELILVEDCNIDQCPIHCSWRQWSDYSACSKVCGDGIKTRTRTSVGPYHSGNACTGDKTEEANCKEMECPVHGTPLPWAKWSTCSKSCGGGQQERIRKCSVPQHGGFECTDKILEQSQGCNTLPCPINGGWSDWVESNTCTVTCGEGTRIRERTCDNPAPENGGSPCEESKTDIVKCNPDPCPIDAVMGDWDKWSECSATCGEGTRSRNRNCIPAKFGGQPCGHSDPNAWNEQEKCTTILCPVHCTWKEWSEYSTCNEVCGDGKKTRTRTSVGPFHNGNACTGDKEEEFDCNEKECPVHCKWNKWSTYSACNEQCGDGKKTRTRTSVGPFHDGNACTGDKTEEANCKEKECPIDGEMGPWSDWGTCSATCGVGTWKQTRQCKKEQQHGGIACDTNNSVREENCNTNGCPVDAVMGDWTVWGECSVTCGGGKKTRARICEQEQQNGGEPCGTLTGEIGCNSNPCPVDCKWAEWSNWGECSLSCGAGSQKRTRNYGVQQENDGAECQGESEDTQPCNSDICPEDGVWQDWGEWIKCSLECAGGKQTRSRVCKEPVAGGQPCIGKSTEEQGCNEDPCKDVIVNGGWSDWEGLSICTKTCGGGTQRRERTCDNPTPENGGVPCQGESTDTTNCNSHSCEIKKRKELMDESRGLIFQNIAAKCNGRITQFAYYRHIESSSSNRIYIAVFRPKLYKKEQELYGMKKNWYTYAVRAQLMSVTAIKSGSAGVDVSEVDLDVKQGDVLGVIGEKGSTNPLSSKRGLRWPFGSTKVKTIFNQTKWKSYKISRMYTYDTYKKGEDKWLRAHVSLEMSITCNK